MWDIWGYEIMKSDRIRAGWRSFMLLFLRFGISPLARGVLPCPTLTFEDHGFRDRLLGYVPDCKPLLERGSCSAVAMMEILLANKVASEVAIENVVGGYQAACFLRRARRRQSFSTKDVQELINCAGTVFGSMRIPDEWALADFQEPSDELKSCMEWFQWYLGVNVVSFFQWGLPFPVLLRIAREASDPVATTALARAIAIDKSVLGLPWAIRRLEEAASKDDKTLMCEIGEALAAATVPKRLRADAVDFFLCMFDPWLSELPLTEQATLLREGGLTVSAKAVRNRRSRLGLPKVNRSGEMEIPEELQPLLKQTEDIMERGFRPH